MTKYYRLGGFTTVWEARLLRSQCCQGWCPLRFHSLDCRWPCPPRAFTYPGGDGTLGLGRVVGGSLWGSCLLSLAQRVGGARLVFNSFSEGVPYAAFPCVSGRTWVQDSPCVAIWNRNPSFPAAHFSPPYKNLRWFVNIYIYINEHVLFNNIKKLGDQGELAHFFSPQIYLHLPSERKKHSFFKMQIFLQFIWLYWLVFQGAGHLLYSLVVDTPAAMSPGHMLRNAGTEMTLAKHF